MIYRDCRCCGEIKPVEDFHKKSGGKFGKDSICKDCSRKKTYAYRQDQMSAQSKYTIARRSSLKSKYGITLEEYERMFEEQGGVCAICSEREHQNKLLAVDHCHKTQKVRGLLCSLCNTAIGKLKDDPRLLKKAIEYLEAHGEDD